MKAPEVKALVDTLTERVENIIRSLDALKADQKQESRELATLKLEVVEKSLALIKRDVEELKKGHDVWGNRIFMLVIAIVAAVLGAFLKGWIDKH